jgi:hypothetical protein
VSLVGITLTVVLLLSALATPVTLQHRVRPRQRSHMAVLNPAPDLAQHAAVQLLQCLTPDVAPLPSARWRLACRIRPPTV